MEYVIGFFVVCLLIIIASIVSKDNEKANEKVVPFRKPVGEKASNSSRKTSTVSPVPKIYKKSIILKGSWELLSPDEANRLIADKAPLTTDIRIYSPTLKRTRKLLESLEVGMSLEVDWKEWDEPDGYGGEKHFYSVFVKTPKGEPIGMLDRDLRREVLIKLAYIRDCRITRLQLDPTPQVRVTINYK